MTRTRWLLVVGVIVVLLVAAAVVVVVRLSGDDDPAERAVAADATFAEAIAIAPEGAQRVLWTDWGGVRRELGLALDAGSGADEVEELLDRGFDADLTSATALDSSAVTMQEVFGFSPASLEWEMFTQSATSASLTMRLGEGVTTDDVAASLRALGYDEPAEPTGIWSGASDLPVAGQVTPELTFVALDADAGLVLASDQSTGVQAALDAYADAGSPSLPGEVVEELGTPLTAVAYDGPQACSALAMAQADPAEQEVADDLVAQAGKVNPVTGFAIGAEPGGGVRVALGFETDEQARTNADSRGVLASGAAPGQGGDFGDRFAVDEVSALGRVVRLDLTPVEGAFVVSELSTGPVLFATC